MRNFTPLFFILLSLICTAQTQIGDAINGVQPDNAGSSLDMSSDGTIVAVGGPTSIQSAETAGRVRVFQNNSNVWTQLGNDILGVAAFDRLGTSVALSSSGTILAIGIPQRDSNGTNSGQAAVYEYVANEWTLKGNVINGFADEELGQNIALSSDGSILAVSAWRNIGNENDNGRVRIYEFENGL